MAGKRGIVPLKNKRPFSRRQNANRRVFVHGNLIAFLKRNSVPFEIIEKKETHHALEAATVTGIPLQKIAKTLVFLDEKKHPFVAVLRADMNVNKHKLFAIGGFLHIELASDEFAEKLTGFPTGGIPPIGHRKQSMVFVDSSLLKSQDVWCGGGSRTKLVKLRVQDILRISKGKVGQFGIIVEKK